MGVKISSLVKRSKSSSTADKSSEVSLVSENALKGKVECFITVNHIILVYKHWLRTELDDESEWDEDDYYVPVDLVKLIERFILQKTRTLEDFESIRVIGRSLFGKVVAVRDTLGRSEEDRQRIYAMKTIKKKKMVLHRRTEKMYQELELYKAISDADRNRVKESRFLTHLHWSFDTHTTIFWVLDFFDGGVLSDHLESKTKFTEQEALSVCAQVTLALHCLHTQFNAVHRAVRPKSILVSSDGHITLGNYNALRMLDEGKPISDTFGCLPQYMSPEMCKGDPYLYPSDWWTLGILLFQLVSGVSPFDDVNETNISLRIQEESVEIPSTFSEDLQRLINGLLEKDPAMRLGSVDGAREIRNQRWWFATGGDGYENATQMWDAILKKSFDPVFKPLKFSELEKKEIDAPDTPVFDDQVEYEIDERFDFLFTA